MTQPATAKDREVLVLGDTRDIHHHGCEAVVRQLLMGLENSGITPTRVVAGMNWSAQAEDFLNADLVVINGEGGLHHDRPIVEEVLDLAIRRRELSRPTALVNTSWFANSPANTRRLAAFDLIAMRDPLSWQEVSSFKLDCISAPDLAIRESSTFAAPDMIPSGRFMVSDSTRTDITRQLRSHAKKSRWDYLPILYAPTSPRPSNKSRKIFLKIRVARAVGPLAGCLMSPRYHAHLAGVPDLPAYMNALRRSRGVLTGRFHTACLCIGLGVPFVAVGSNTEKIRSLLLDTGLSPETRMIPAGSLNKVDSIPPFTVLEMESLKSFRLESETRFLNLFDAIRNLIPSNP